VKNIILLRHAEAVPHDARRDFDRELTQKGRLEAQRAGKQLQALQLLPNRVLSSPALRARETAELACEALGIAPGSISLHTNLYQVDASGLVDIINEEPPRECLLVVGHNPAFSECSAYLAGHQLHLEPAHAAHLVCRAETAPIHPDNIIFRGVIAP
jgi:phosphohistidine phosphatase